MTSAALDATGIARARAGVVARSDLAGRSLAEQLASQADGWFQTLGASLPGSWALMASGGYARGMLCPGSDIDVVLLHPRRARTGEIRAVAESIWYPIWDSGLKLSPSAHTTRSLLSLAADDLVTATSILSVRRLAGDGAAVERVLAPVRCSSGALVRCVGWRGSGTSPSNAGLGSAK